MNKPKRVLLIDGDQIAYVCAAAAEERTILVKHKPTGIEKSFKTRTEFKEAMQKRNKAITEDYEIEDKVEAESVSFCLKVIKQKIANLIRDTQADEHEIYAGDSNNFRLKLPLPKSNKEGNTGQYKGNRSNTVRPILLPDAKAYLHRVMRAQSVDGMEVDDMLSIRAYEELAKGNIPIIASFDKDTYQAQGCYIYYFKDKNAKVYHIPELGNLTFKAPSTVKGDGLKFLCYQLLVGDFVDGFCSYDCSTKRFGPKTAYNLLKDLASEKECLEMVLKVFKERYPEPFTYTAWDDSIIESSWKHQLEMYFACCWMKRSRDDPSSPWILFDKYNVEYE